MFPLRDALRNKGTALAVVGRSGVACAPSSPFSEENVHGRLAHRRAVHGDLQLHLPLPVHRVEPHGATERGRLQGGRRDAHRQGSEGRRQARRAVVHRSHAFAQATAEGNITVGLIVDERASDKQVEAISAIATGAAGGPMAALGPLVGKVAGVEKRPIRFEGSGMEFSVKAGELIDQALEGVPDRRAPVSRSIWTTPATR